MLDIGSTCSLLLMGTTQLDNQYISFFLNRVTNWRFWGVTFVTNVTNGNISNNLELSFSLYSESPVVNILSHLLYHSLFLCVCVCVSWIIWKLHVPSPLHLSVHFLFKLKFSSFKHNCNIVQIDFIYQV